MPQALSFTTATDMESLRQEFVTDLKARAGAASNEARSKTSAADKKALEAVARAFINTANAWEETLLGDPRKAQVVQAPTPQVAGGKSS